MKQFLYLLFITTCLIAQGINTDTKMLVEVDLGKESEHYLELTSQYQIDLAGFDGTTGSAQFLVNFEEYGLLQSLGLPISIIYYDSNRELREKYYGAMAISQSPEGQTVVRDSSLGLYHTFAEMTADLIQLSNTYSSLARLDSIGSSIEGRTIWAMKISDDVDQFQPDEPEVLYLGNHHAREVISVEVPLYFAHYLLENYSSNQRVRNIVDQRQIWIIPMVNPDGHVYVETVDLNWRKNRRNNGDGTWGVDLNRNYSYQWGYDNIGSSPNTSSGTYRGMAPFSEPEISTIATFIETHNFVTAFTYHAYGGIYIYPWGYYNGHSDENDLFENMGIHFSMHNNYRYGNSWETLVYLMNGEAVDWMYGDTLNKPPIYALTVEVGNSSDGFHPDPNRIQTLVDLQLEPNLLLAEFAGNPTQVIPSVPQPTLKMITCDDTGFTSAVWDSVQSEALGGYRIQNWNNDTWDTILAEDQLTTQSQQASFPISYPAFIRLTAVDTATTPGSGYPSDVYSVNCGQQSPTILIVDGFDRTSGNWTRLQHRFVADAGVHLAEYDWNFNSCDNDAIIDGMISLDDYYGVIWILGDESTVDITFSLAEQTAIIEYLENGGRLFISGSEIGWDLVQQGNQIDQAFYQNYLKAEFIADDSDNLAVTGTTNSIFAGMSFEYGSTSAGSPYSENYPDVITPVAGSRAALVYQGSNDIAAIQFEGYFGNGTIPAKLVYLAFPFETIHSATIQQTVLYQVLYYFMSPLTIDENLINLPDQVALNQNYPNPFNPSTTINYTLRSDSFVELEIFDITGKNIRTLVSERKLGGNNEIAWDGTNQQGIPVASGVYIYSLITPDASIQRKMILIR
ncbi:MAG: T9SS type A sorting domain-containing protein [Candidatus Marinimicrobia bacterium]|nr:T9SS type A sorting domain-containing protein [Candidatus Neomarinimicrobiota bacterium]